MIILIIVVDIIIITKALERELEVLQTQNATLRKHSTAENEGEAEEAKSGNLSAKIYENITILKLPFHFY